MSPRSWQARIEDILTCISHIEDFTAGMTFEQFVQDTKTIRAVAFELSTIGEAARAMPDEIRQRFPQIPWDKLLAIRNIVIHEYFRIDEEILWKTVQQNIPPLVPIFEKMLNANRE